MPNETIILTPDYSVIREKFTADAKVAAATCDPAEASAVRSVLAPLNCVLNALTEQNDLNELRETVSRILDQLHSIEAEGEND